MKPRSTKAKGTKLEKWVAGKLAELGVPGARRQPGSGVYQGFPHDVTAKYPVLGRVVVECKKWKHGWRTGNTAIGTADLLVIQADRDDPYVYCTWDHYARLVKAVIELQEAVDAKSAEPAPATAAGSAGGADYFEAVGDRPRA